MNWTTELPTKAGAYWWKSKDWIPDEAAQLAKVGETGQTCIHARWEHTSDWGGLWCGPLVPIDDLKWEVEKAWAEGWSDHKDIQPMATMWKNSRAKQIASVT